jgi:hypothetical protein
MVTGFLTFMLSAFSCSKQISFPTYPVITPSIQTISVSPDTGTETPPPGLKTTAIDTILAEQYEQQFLKSAKLLETTGTHDNWQVMLIRAGNFNVSILGKVTSYLRIDLTVTNIDKESDYFQPRGIMVLWDQRQMNIDSLDSTLTTISDNYYPNSPVTGYWLFPIQGSFVQANAKLVFSISDSNFQWLFQL